MGKAPAMPALFPSPTPLKRHKHPVIPKPDPVCLAQLGRLPKRQCRQGGEESFYL